MSSSTDIKRLDKHIPSNILCSLAYVDYETFPVDCDPVSRTEMLRILHNFLRTGEDFKKIKEMLLEITENKENELSDFVKNYKERKTSHIMENVVMILIGFLLAFGLIKSLILLRDK